MEFLTADDADLPLSLCARHKNGRVMELSMEVSVISASGLNPAMVFNQGEPAGPPYLKR